MARVYLLTEQDMEALRTAIDRDPAHGEKGGSSTVLSESERRMFNEAHGFYNYQVRRWIDQVTK